MPTALFTSKNLVGDSLCISAALRAWHKLHPEYEIDLLTNDDSVAELYQGMGVPLRVVFTRDEGFYQPVGELPGEPPTYKHYGFEFNFDVNKAFAICDTKKCHLAQGYADSLGVKIGDKPEDLGPFYDPDERDTELIHERDMAWVDKVPQDTILIAPFSRSCTSHEGKPPNKTLPWAKWKPILRFLRTLKRPIRVTGSANERADQLGFSEEEYLTGMPLRPLARAMKQGKISLVVCVDNGISHLTGSQKIPQILYYPLCLGLHYAVPWSNPYVVPIHIDPALVEPAQLLWSTKQVYSMLERMKSEPSLLSSLSPQGEEK
jgi:ADP-heptose:LPS heptosyltransferase